VLSRVQLLSQDVSVALANTTERCVASLPRLLREVENMQQEVGAAEERLERAASESERVRCRK
jgi:hypothetical protein